MGRLYRNPPVIEAVCEFRFEPGPPWDWTIPGLVYERVKQDFPKKRQQNILEMEARTEGDLFSQVMKGGIARVLFLRDDERALIQVSPDLLAVNQLRPYSNWQSFKAIIERALAVYRDVAAPVGFRRIGLRYINRIEVPQQSVRVEEYLRSFPQIPPGIPRLMSAWAQRVEIPFEEEGGLLILQAGSIREEVQTDTAFLLDLDFSTLHAEAVSLDSAVEWLEKAHSAVERVFEACITPKARELFQEVSGDE